VEARETVGCERLAVQPEVFRSLRDEVVHVEGITLSRDDVSCKKQVE
jgi:hypothetical protein